MNVSNIGSLGQNNAMEIRRRRKIQYRKPKGRLTQKASGVLNKSICRRNANNDDESNQSQLIMVKDVNSFLTRNRQLAKALEESRCQAKELAKDKFTYQLECIEMREKLSIVHNSVLKCTCAKETNSLNVDSLDLLNNMKETIKQSMDFLNDYMASIVASKISNGDEESLQYNSNATFARSYTEVGSQTVSCSVVDTETQCYPVSMKNKKLQVRLGKHDTNNSIQCNRKHVDDEVEEYKEYHNKAIQCVDDINACIHEHKAIQCSLQTTVFNNTMKRNRQPLTMKKNINQLDNTNTNQLKSIMKKNFCAHPLIHRTSTTNKSRREPTFRIYEDSPGDNKENTTAACNKYGNIQKKVTIHSPAEIHVFDKSLDNIDSRLRHRKNNTCYKEPNINRKLTKADPTVDTRFYNSPYQIKGKKSKRRRKKKANMNKSIALEDIISMVEESFLACGAGQPSLG